MGRQIRAGREFCPIVAERAADRTDDAGLFRGLVTRSPRCRSKLSGFGQATRAVIEFRLLGAVEATRSGAPLPLGGRRQQALLALLLLDAGRPVSPDYLVEELWMAQPPAAASTTLRAYVSKLRRALGSDVSITASAAGYAIDAPAEHVDAQVFERLVKEGREARARGAAALAGEHLRAALALWRGRPFAGHDDSTALRAEADRLEELRLLALEERIEADLALGQAEALVEELEALVREHPHRERFWRQLMLALYRAQRQADALGAYRRARQLLDEKLGLEPSEELKQLEQAILRHDVPPARRPEERHNLPASLSSFVGRETELDDLQRLLGQTRLLTLTGVGGAGKTRLALECATRALSAFPDGVYFVDYSALTDPELVPREAATALGVDEQPETGIRDLLAARLDAADLLLVLDNCEHLRDACAELAHDLLAACPRLRILATSREPLGAPGEVDYPVPPLEVPAPDATPDELRASESVLLLLARARQASPRLADDERTLVSAGRICRDLDGLPLAIELAAARAKALSLEDIASRLADRFRFLVSWRRVVAARHRTLREAMDWSYQLLSREEQTVLARLSVFAGSFTLPAVAAVCLDADEERALAVVERLVEASLVVVQSHDGQSRYRLLETVRQYAAELLRAAEAVAETTDRHSAYYLDLAEENSRGIYEHGTFARRDLVPDDANLRAALVHFEAAGSDEHHLRLCAALWRYWWLRGEITEGRRQLDAALERATTNETAAKTEGLRGASTLALRQGDFAAAAALAGEAVELSTALGEVELGRSKVALANALASLGDLDRGERLYGESADAFRAAGRKWELANLLLNMADLALNRGDLEAGEQIASESLSLSRTLGEEAGIAVNLGNLAFAALERGDADRAFALLVDAIGHAHAIGFGEWTAIMLVGLAAVACTRGADQHAAEILGAAERLLEEIGAALDSIERRVHTRTVVTLRNRLGEEEYTAAFESGRGLSTAGAVELAISG
jgi:predicted ATPase/DNA-binding SARP family transcriptional activator